jgi:lactose/L-arabinose transport system substrate-binding protein
MQAAVPSFHAAHPDIEATVNMAGAQLQARFMLSLSAGVGAPDVSQLQNAEVMRYAVTGRLADLTPLAKKYWDAFPESVWKDCTHEGKVYGIPWDLGPCAVFYKRDLFAKYGIEPNAIETWDDYIAAGERILQLSGGKTHMLIHPTSYQEIMFEMLLRQGNGQIFDEQGRVAVNSPIALHVLSIMRRFIDTGISSNTGYWTQPFFASFSKESVATYPMAVWFGGMVRDYAPSGTGHWGVFPLPAQERGGLRISSFGGSVLVIPEQCPNKDAAIAFVEFMLCREDTQLLHYKNFDLFPALTTVYDNPFFDEPVEYFAGQPVRRLFTRDVEKIPPMNRTQDWIETGLYLRQALGKWAAGGMNDPAAFLGELEAGLARRLDREIAPESLSRKK